MKKKIAVVKLKFTLKLNEFVEMVGVERTTLKNEGMMLNCVTSSPVANC